MRPWRHQLPTLAFLILLLVLGTRAAWHASQSEVGWQMLRADWGRILARWVRTARPALADREPEEQARFWMDEVDRIPHPITSPGVAAGAAWMLDAPQSGFVQRHLRETTTLGIDHDTVERSIDRFEEMCRDRCVALTERAVELDPVDVEMIRARALLLFRWDPFGSEFEPRRSDWVQLLKQCAAQDPDNALYDYLAAAYLWSRSAIVIWDDNRAVLHIRDDAGFEEAKRRLAAGLKKPRLMFGAEAVFSAVEFLQFSSLSKFERVASAESCTIYNRATQLLLIRLYRWQQRWHDIQRQNGEFEDAAATLRSILMFSDQCAREGNPAFMIYEPVLVRRFALAYLVDLAAQAPEAFNADETEKMASELREVNLEMEILGRVARKQEKDRPQTGITESSAATIAVITQPIAEQLLLVGFCVSPLAWAFYRKHAAEQPKDVLFAHVVAWSLGLGLSFVVFGLCPAGIISAEVQTWVVRGIVCVPVGIALLATFVVLQLRFRIPFGQSLAVTATLSLPRVVLCYWRGILELFLALLATLHPLIFLLLCSALIAASFATVQSNLELLRRTDMSPHRKGWLMISLVIFLGLSIPWGPTVVNLMQTYLGTRVWVPSRVWDEAKPLGLTAEALRSSMGPDSTHWSLLQWHAYSGPFVGAAVALLVLVAMMRRSIPIAGGIRQILRTGKRALLYECGTLASRSLLLAGGAALLIYLATVPAAIDEREAYYQRHYTRLVDPAAARRELDAEIAAIRADSSLMDELRRKADK